MIDRTLKHYRVMAALGAGGMGEVYLAQDTTLGRKVALKILPADVASNRDRMERFVREAKAAAALNHPNIAHIYEIGESEGTPFIAMEYVDGVTLREKIHHAREPLLALLGYLAQVAEGLAKAHHAGIVHRDLKPDNVMITRDGYAKILDFGLAKLVESPAPFGIGQAGSDRTVETVQQSIPGTVLGTIGYMSPEQASGRVHEIDHRSDIFSLGCLLFEAATGQKAFEGKDALDSLHKIVYAPTPQVKDVSPVAPEALQRVIGRCLAKDPARRYQSIKDVAVEIDDLRQELKGFTGPVASEQPSVGVTPSGAGRADEGFWVAVLPFKHRGAHADLEALADGLAEDIVMGLLRFSHLRVVSRSSTRRFSGEAADIRAVGRELGARYVMEGSLRQAGATLRVAVQFVDATTGAHLWAETYDRTFDPDAMFVLQDDLVPRIVSTVADWYGVLPHSMSEAVRLKPLDHLTPYEALLRSFGYYERIVPEEHAAARSALERAVQQAPAHGEIWAMLSMLYGEEYRFGFNAQPDPLGRSLQAARRAIAAAPSSHYAHLAMAQALFFRKEFDAFRNAAGRAVALNPMDGSTMEYVGHLLAFAGEWERGCELAEKARHLNPHHAAWYWALPFLDAYRKADYVTARTYMLKADMPGQFFSLSLLAAVHGQLGEREAAEDYVREVLALKPDFPQIARDEFAKWYPPELVEQLIEGLRKAGLDIAGEMASPTPQPRRPGSGATQADEGFWVAVLPFKSTGAAAEIAALAEGLSEEIVTGLSRFSYFRVIGRGSTLRYASQTGDLRVVGKELGARYVIEGSLRQVGSMLRVAVQLVDASTGAELWAETYDRQFRAEDVFALQDELTPRIVSTVADQYGALVHSMSESLRGRRADQYSAHEAVLRAFGYLERITPEEHKEVREILEAAASAAPGHSDCQAMLAVMYWHEYANGFNVGPDPLGRAHAAARQAVATAPTNHLAHHVLATVLFYQKDFLAFRPSAERALALNRMDASTTAFLGNLIAYSGDWEYGLGVIERAKQLNPHHAGWYHFPALHYAYHRRDYRGALEIALKINMPGYFFTHSALAAVYGQLGEVERARAALRELHALVPDFGAIARKEYGKWFDAEVTEHLMEGLRKAGLRVAGAAESSASIAVLPFGNLSPDPDNEFFADGLTEEVIADLSVIRALRVISRTSAMQFKGTDKDLRAIARELGVRYVLEGSVRRAGTSLRVTAQLIDAENDSHLWAEKYSGSIEDVFAIQEEISRKIANALQLRLTDAEARVIAERPIDNAAAYDCYMRARHEVYRFTAEGLDRAQKLVDDALSLIGENALLVATKGMVSWYYLNFSIRPEERYLNEAAACAARALEHDSQNYVGIFLQGLVASKRGDMESAIRDLRAAHERKPGDAMVLNELVRHYFSAGQEQSESARTVLEQSLRLDPLHPLNWAQAAWRHFSAGRNDEAVEAARRVLQLTDRGNPARVYAAYYLALANMREEAIGLFEAEGAALPGAYGSVSLFLSRALQGDPERAVKHVTPQLEQAASWTEYLALFLADGYSLVGRYDEAIRWVPRAVALGFINYPYLATRDPFLANVRPDPRFTELMRVVKARWEALGQ